MNHTFILNRSSVFQMEYKVEVSIKKKKKEETKTKSKLIFSLYLISTIWID